MALSDIMDPNCACDLPCGECGKDEFKADYEYEFFGDDEDDFDDVRCCYQWGGPKECHCAMMAEEERKQQSRLYQISQYLYVRRELFFDWYYGLKAKYFPAKRTCDNCQHKFSQDLNNCPKCNHCWLPF